MSAEQTADGLVTIPSRHSVGETLRLLEQLLAANGLKLFAVIDHSGEAEKSGLIMPNTKVAIFGSPRAGTPLMLAVPNIAIDLPMKILIREDAESTVWVTYNNLEWLGKRHRLSPDMLQPLAGIVKLAEKITA